jgi:hypothetical protein
VGKAIYAIDASVSQLPARCLDLVKINADLGRFGGLIKIG